MQFRGLLVEANFTTPGMNRKNIVRNLVIILAYQFLEIGVSARG